MLFTYDNSFNKNELFVTISLLIELMLFWKLRKRFPPKNMLTFFIVGYFFGMTFDHTISIEPFDYYDVNDNSSYQFIDALTYLMYSPYLYFFISLYDYMKIKLRHTPLYVLFWALISIGLEFVADLFGVYHYKNGYKIFYSFPIYLSVLSSVILLYKYINSSTSEN